MKRFLILLTLLVVACGKPARRGGTAHGHGCAHFGGHQCQGTR